MLILLLEFLSENSHWLGMDSASLLVAKTHAKIIGTLGFFDGHSLPIDFIKNLQIFDAGKRSNLSFGGILAQQLDNQLSDLLVTF